MILKPKARIIWKRERGPRQLRAAALAAEAARRRRDAPTTKPDLAVLTESGRRKESGP
jgi:hypothetical protein